MKPKQKAQIICRCNNVSRETIEAAIRDGAKTLNEIFDATTAGVGPCGGSCRKKIGPFLEHYLKTGEFPEVVNEKCNEKK
ncbi:MAG: (2Fe-2S)-binding protein [Bdellovibrio sp.]